MKRLIAIVFILLLVVAFVFFGIGPSELAKRVNPVGSPPPYNASQRATQLHQRLFIADLHADSLLWDRDLLDYGEYGHVDIPRLIEGHVALQAFTVVTVF